MPRTARHVSFEAALPKKMVPVLLLGVALLWHFLLPTSASPLGSLHIGVPTPMLTNATRLRGRADYTDTQPSVGGSCGSHLVMCADGQCVPSGWTYCGAAGTCLRPRWTCCGDGWCCAAVGCAAGGCSSEEYCPHSRCDGSISGRGCCIDTSTDPFNCGRCGNVCSMPANGWAWCAGGSCRIECASGFTQRGSSCEERDPCDGVDCGSSSSCSYGSCSCNSGYTSPTGDGRNCRPIDLCQGINCGPYSSCYRGTCSCNSGYTSPSGDGKNCRQINPCEGVSCGDYSSCSQGACTCNSGYTSSSGDGKNCLPIDLCQGINCGDYSSCSRGTCTCNPNYSSSTGDGKNCRPIDPCEGVNCGDYASCSQGTCTCNSRYISPSGDGKNCRQINPCEGVNCGDHSSCSQGACTCNSGYTSSSGDGKNCLPIDLCQGINCGDYSSCSRGTCTCNPNYASSTGDGKNCQLIDPCRGITCPSGQVCNQGACVCATGLTSCGGSCIALDSDSRNCGACGTACPDGQSCSQGRCVCPGGLTNCNGFCVSLDSDRSHCGRCENSCPVDSTGCSSGACQFRPTCSAGQTNCGSESSLNCVALDSDLRHCGACGRSCPSGQICSSGTCGCSNGLTACGSACVATSSDINHCGQCNSACGSGAVGCTNGVCQVPAAPAPPPPPPLASTATMSTPSSAASTAASAAAKSTAVNGGATSTLSSTITLHSATLQSTTVSFASAPSAIATPAGFTVLSLPAGTRVFLVTGSRGLSCGPNCVLLDGSSGEYAVAGVPGSAAIGLRRGSSCLQVQLAGASSTVVEASCPSLMLAQHRRQNGPQLFPYWVLFNSSSGSMIVLNANMNVSSGCLQASSESIVSLGSCSSAAAAQWSAPSVVTAASTASSSGNIGAIVGGVVGGIVAIAAAVGIGFYMKRRRQAAQAMLPAKAPSPTGRSVSTLADDDSSDHDKKVPLAGGLPGQYPALPEMVEPTVPAPDALTKEAPVQQELASSKVSSDATAASRTATNPGSVPVVTGLSVTNTNVASPGPQRSTGSGEGAVNIQISPAASKLLVSKDDIAIDREKRLGEGGFGVVYVGTLRGSTKVAVKTIKGDLDEKAMAAFVKEVANWEGLVQRNVLPLMAFCVSPPMMVMDLIEEGNLRKYLGARAWDQALGRRFLHDVACGMAYLHSAGILHGDLKSLNVLVDGSRAVITDFGLSRVRVEVSKSTQRTGNGLQGTPGFVAPEVLSGEPIRPPADVYAFAMTCYEVVSRGKYPFEDIHNVAAIVYRVAIDKMRPERPQGVADDLWALIERAWQHDAAARPDFVQLENELARMSM